VLFQEPRWDGHRKGDVGGREDDGEDHALLRGEDDLAPLILELAVEREYTGVREGRKAEGSGVQARGAMRLETCSPHASPPRPDITCTCCCWRRGHCG
jgi:hypothetical protein